METEYDSAVAMDIQSLISCIHWHEGSDNEQVVLETLKTITDMCTNETCARDALREESGLDFLVEFMFTTDNAIFLEHSLKTLACVIDENIHNQMYMTKKSVFEVIQTILRNHKFPVITRKNAIILVSAILFQNSTAQSLICEVGLLHDLLNAYEQGAERLLTGNSYAPTSDDPLNELWITSNSALCFAVNNPKNETNQEVCSTIFQISLRILDVSSNADIIGSVSSLLSLCISNNRYCQDTFAKHDGLLACKRLFQKYFDSVLADIRDCNNIIGKGTLQMISNIIGIISAAAFEHENNAAVLGKLGVVSLLVKLLFVKTLHITLKIKIVLSLGHCIDAYCSNKSYVLEIENFDTLLKENLQIENQELSSACKYLLQVCLMHEEASDQEENTARVDNFFDINKAMECFKGETKCKSRCPDTKKVCKATETRSSTKRPSNCLSSSKSKDDCNQKFSSKYSTSDNCDKLQCKKSRMDISNESPSNPADLNAEYSFSHPRYETESTGKKGYCSGIFASLSDLKNTAKNATFSPKPLNKTDFLHAKECQMSDSSSDSSSTYYPAGTLLMEMAPQMEPSSEWPFDPLNCNPSQNQTPRKISQGKNELKMPPDSKRVLTERTNLDEPGFQLTQKQLKFRFDPVMATPNGNPPGTHSSSRQIPSLNSDFLAFSLNHTQRSEKLGKSSRDGGRQASSGCSGSVKSSFQSHKRCAPETPNLSRENAKRKKRLLSSLTPGICPSPNELNESYSTNCVQVIVFPGEKCEEHNLISSFESLQVVPLDEVQRP